ncbi:MAG: hypothetical protein K9W46_07050 [Candidatus Heimdallarchaeum endolithica]|uniref:MalT-like TPR region domain-containing protein n=1 Tax=Candidatus Heimdallarchaeum endolithica TaxID=2876572 RepID=A0A9Y1BU05_9ARCH|nr:MAG: hypothetical protein K9W46_07050 [Candidatus Heimdallarchaeum endolithica]
MRPVNTLPPEIQAHQNRISVEVRELFIKTLKGKLSSDTSSHIGRLMWNIISDPVYESDEELKYLAAKIGTIVGHYDVAIKSIDDKVPGSVVWGSFALFEIGEIDEAFSNLELVISMETNDILPLIEAIILYIYLKSLIGDTDGLFEYVEKLDLILSSRQSRFLPGMIKKFSLFAKGLIDIHSKSAIEGYEQVNNFYGYCKSVGDQFWQSLALLILGDQKLDLSDFISAEKIYSDCLELATNLSNSALVGAAKIGVAHVLYLKGELKQANFAVTQAIKGLQEKSQYYLGLAYFVKGKILVRLGQHTNARQNYSLAETLSRKYKNYNNILMAMLELADSYFIINEKKKAQEIYKKAYSMITNIANKKQFTKALVQIASGDFYQGNYKKAMERINKIETLSEEIIYQKGKADAIKLRAQLNIQQSKNIMKQIQALKAAQILYLEVGDNVNSANCDIVIAKAYIRIGNSKDASIYLERAKQYYMKISDNLMIAEIKEIQAEFDIKEGRYDEALVKLRSSYSHYSDIFDTSGKTRCIRKIADSLALKGSFDEAIARYRKLKDSLEQIDEKLSLIVLHINLGRTYLASNKMEKAKEEYNIAVNLLENEKISKYLVSVLREKIFLYLVQGDKEQVFEQLEKLESLIMENEHEIFSLYSEIITKQLSLFETKENNFLSLIKYLQGSIQNRDVLTSLEILVNILYNEINLYSPEIGFDEIKKAELGNYIKLLRTLSYDYNLYYFQGIYFLIEIIWYYLIGELEKQQVSIIEASSFFTEKGFETLSNLLVDYQYNFSVWSGDTGSKLSIIRTPRKYEDLKSMLLEILEFARYSIFVDQIRDTEFKIVNELNK